MSVLAVPVVIILVLLYLAVKFVKYADMLLPKSIPPINPQRVVSAAERLNTPRLAAPDEHYESVAQWLPADVRREIEAGPCWYGRPTHGWYTAHVEEFDITTWDGRVEHRKVIGQACATCGTVRTV